MPTLSLSDYDIQVVNVEAALTTFLDSAKYSKILILVDENTKEHCLPILAEAIKMPFETIEIQAGEKHKTIQTCSQIWSAIMEKGIDRKALMINLGGGVIGDMGGFCASTYKRGIDFVQIPTTLLSQVDASIGGKLGIDFAQVKNSVGLFKNPKAVFIDTQFLESLPKREVRSGFAEIIKHCLIHDAVQWKTIQEFEDLSEVDWTEIIPRSLEVKKAIVELDPFEHGPRKSLNFGHTIGHAVESAALETESPLLHGEAIAIGMICEAWLATKYAGLSQNELKIISEFLLKIYGHPNIAQYDSSALLRLMGNDKKNEGSINFTLLKSIGEYAINHSASEEDILESLNYYTSL